MRCLFVGCRFWLLSAAVMLLAGVLLAPVFRAGGVSESQVDRIREGMTRAEVEAALGPPFVEVPSPTGLRGPPRNNLDYLLGGLFRGNDRALIVVLDENDVVVDHYILDNGPDRRSLSQRIRRRWD